MDAFGEFDFEREVDELAVRVRNVDPKALTSVDLDEEMPRLVRPATTSATLFIVCFLLIAR